MWSEGLCEGVTILFLFLFFIFIFILESFYCPLATANYSPVRRLPRASCEPT
jgi:hypothetical protein